MVNQKEKQLLTFILKEVNDRGFPPSIREMMKVISVTSLRGVTYHLEELQRKGYIQRERKSRSIKVLPRAFFEIRSDQQKNDAQSVSIPFLGSIAAGTPIFAYNNDYSTIPVPYNLVASGADFFALKVEGDSMIGDHIMNGDIVVIRSQNHAADGEIVVAVVDDEATLKRYYRENNIVRLQPSNPNYQPIFVNNNLNINGVMVGLIRQLQKYSY